MQDLLSFRHCLEENTTSLGASASQGLPAEELCKIKYTTYGTTTCQYWTPGPVFYGSRLRGTGTQKYSYTQKLVIEKAYISLFVSFTVKAVHLKVVSDLTIKAFFVALRLFIARRWKPYEIFSDNMSNFVGAAKEITTTYHFLSKPDP